MVGMTAFLGGGGGKGGGKAATFSTLNPSGFVSSSNVGRNLLIICVVVSNVSHPE